ncbi:SDR family oxidoreductase [Verrucomicrobia bacterium]|nr:SDR family oxidoreductase [Verrucomicrobiota bacterium]
MQISKRFENRVILITGGSSGIGYAAAQRFAEEGGKCILVARDQARLDAAANSLDGDNHVAVSVDCADENLIRKRIKEVCQVTGPLFAGVFSAGIHQVRPLAMADSRHFTEILSANVLTAGICASVFAKFADKKGGSMVFLSSAAALKGSAAISAYSASKAALIGLARSLAVELAPKRIRVNVVSPGVVQTDMTKALFSNLTKEQVAEIEKAHLLGLGEPEQVASAISFLASEESSWITGTNLSVDGGFVAH